MAQQTPIQQAIDKLHNKVVPPRSYVGVGIAMAIDILVELLPVEQKHIATVFEKGQQEEAREVFWTKGNYYYHQTYKTEENGKEQH